MNNAIRSFNDFGSTKPVLILGDMFELGESSGKEHQKIIELLKSVGFEDVYLVGDEFYNLRETNSFNSFATTEELKSYLIKNLLVKKTILIKGSRGMKLESLLDIL